MCTRPSASLSICWSARHHQRGALIHGWRSPIEHYGATNTTHDVCASRCHATCLGSARASCSCAVQRSSICTTLACPSASTSACDSSSTLRPLALASPNMLLLWHSGPYFTILPQAPTGRTPWLRCLRKGFGAIPEPVPATPYDTFLLSDFSTRRTSPLLSRTPPVPFTSTTLNISSETGCTYF